MTTEVEIKFIDRIDCNFPYQDRNECLKLIDEASTLSTNAIFFVVEEICRIPFSEKEKTTKAFLLELLRQVEIKFDHPLKEMVLDTAHQMVNEIELTVDEAISRMAIIRKYPRQYAALNIIYFSCDDKEDKIESLHEEIKNEWEEEYYPK